MSRFLRQLLIIGLVFVSLGVPTGSGLQEPSVVYIEPSGTNASQVGLQCEKTWTETSPFLISDSYKNDSFFPGKFNPKKGNSYERNWDNFRLMKDSEGIGGFIPQRTIVRLINDSHKNVFPDISEKRNVRVPVEVVSVPQFKDREKTANSKAELKSMMKNELMVVTKGKVGRIDARVLQPAGRFTYLITEDTFFQKISGLDDNIKTRAKAVELVTKELDKDCKYRESSEESVRKERATELANQLKKGKDCQLQYNVNKCCLNGVCTLNYIWKILDTDLNEIGEFEKDPNTENCDILEHLRPIDQEQERTAENILKITEMAIEGMEREEGDEFSLNEIQYIDSTGLIAIPLDTYEYVNELGKTVQVRKGPYNMTVYRPDCKDANCDFMLNNSTACAYFSVLKKWNEKHPEDKYSIQQGNGFHPVTWGASRTHEKMSDDAPFFGTCMDIRPLNKDDSPIAINVKEEYCPGGKNGTSVKRRISGNYDKAQTKEFISLLKQAGASNIFFGGNGVGANTRIPCHGNHIHFCFDPKSTKVQKACENGI